MFWPVLSQRRYYVAQHTAINITPSFALWSLLNLLICTFILPVFLVPFEMGHFITHGYDQGMTATLLVKLSLVKLALVRQARFWRRAFGFINHWFISGFIYIPKPENRLSVRDLLVLERLTLSLAKFFAIQRWERKATGLFFKKIAVELMNNDIYIYNIRQVPRRFPEI